MIMQADYALEKFKNGGSETMRGTVKWFNTQKGYGFITGDDGAEYFAHQTQIKMDGFRTLDAGDIVEFDVRSEEKGISSRKYRAGSHIKYDEEESCERTSAFGRSTGGRI